MSLGELIVIAAIALIVMGPEKFPDFAKVVLRTIRDLRGFMDDVKRDVASELKPIKQELESSAKLTRYDHETYMRSLEDAERKANDEYNYGSEETRYSDYDSGAPANAAPDDLHAVEESQVEATPSDEAASAPNGSPTLSPEPYSPPSAEAESSTTPADEFSDVESPKRLD